MFLLHPLNNAQMPRPNAPVLHSRSIYQLHFFCRCAGVIKSSMTQTAYMIIVELLDSFRAESRPAKLDPDSDSSTAAPGLPAGPHDALHIQPGCFQPPHPHHHNNNNNKNTNIACPFLCSPGPCRPSLSAQECLSKPQALPSFLPAFLTHTRARARARAGARDIAAPPSLPRRAPPPPTPKPTYKQLNHTPRARARPRLRRKLRDTELEKP